MKMMEKPHGEKDAVCAILERQALLGIGHDCGMKMRFSAFLRRPLHHVIREVAAHEREPLIEKKPGKSAITAGEVQDAERAAAQFLENLSQNSLLSAINKLLVLPPVPPLLVFLNLMLFKRGI
jgi:hypothetical protein